MIANINKEGLLSIVAETELEAYALMQWCFNNNTGCENIQFDATLGMAQCATNKPLDNIKDRV